MARRTQDRTPGRWLGLFDSVADVKEFLAGKRSDLFQGKAQAMRDDELAYSIVPPAAPAPQSGWQGPAPIGGRMPKQFSSEMEWNWRGHSATVRPLFGSGTGRALDGAVVYEVGTATEPVHVLRVPLADRIEELVVLDKPGTSLDLVYDISMDATVTEVKQTPGGWLELWSGDHPYLRLNAIEALDAARHRLQGRWEIEGQGRSRIARVRLSLDGAAYPVVVDPGWSSTGSLATARYDHTATLLSSGKVLAAGGTFLTSCEIYDPAAGTWSATGSMWTIRDEHTATLLPSGKVLVAGGSDASGPIASCEIYDPAAGTWSPTGSMSTARDGHTATLLSSGRVLVAGASGSPGPLASCETYDPGTGSWAPTGSLATARSYHSATRLQSGLVLVMGGSGFGGALSSCELYDPSAGTWGWTESMLVAMYWFPAVLLSSGKVLIAGGGNGPSADCEIYDPSSGVWAPTGSLLTAREKHSLTLLPSGQVLAATGENGVDLASCELYDPSLATWSATASILTPRAGPTATLLVSGNILVAGGYASTGGTLSECELYTTGPDAMPPSVPVLLTPANSELVNTSTPRLTWNASTDDTLVTNYDVQVASDAGFTNIQYSATVVSTSTTTIALPDGLHYWRVRARDAAGNVSAWSASWTFTTDVNPPSVPVLASPANASGVATSTANLAWNASTDAGSGVQNYDAQVATDAAFTNVVYSATTASTGTTTSSLVDGTYYWEVRARDNVGNVSAWCAAWTFAVDTVPPTAPTASGPLNAGTVYTSRPLLRWTAASDATAVTYQVEVASTNPITPPLAASVSGLTSTQWAPPPLADGVYYWHVRAVDSAGNPGPWSPTWSFVVSGAKGFYVGVGAGGRGELAPFAAGSASYAARPLYTVPWSAYDSAVGETRPAAGDLFGDGHVEVVVGLGRYPTSGGWLAVLSDTGSGFTLLKWLQVPWAAYNAANGETYPACGDIDGDGRAEVVAGLGTYPTAGGWFALFDDATTGYAFLGWRQVNWPQYNAYDGQTRPSVGDVDGDGASEVFIGLGSYPSQGGYVYEFSDRTVTQTGRVQVAWPAYNAANGETWPACGDVDGDGTDEVCLGLGAYPASGGWVEYLKDAGANFAPLAWKQLPWSAYNAASGETRPSLGRMTTGAAQQTVIGLGKNTGALGYVAIYDRAPGFALLGWRQVSDSAYDGANGETRPSAGR